MTPNTLAEIAASVGGEWRDGRIVIYTLDATPKENYDSLLDIVGDLEKKLEKVGRVISNYYATNDKQVVEVIPVRSEDQER